MIRAILVDDRKAHLNLLIKELYKYSKDIEVIGAYTNQQEAVSKIIHLLPDVLFLDVEMPGKNGFELAASVKAICNKVIYLTSYEKYGPDSYRHDALYFIAKDRIGEFLPAAIAKLKATLLIREQQQSTYSSPEASTLRIKKISITDGHKISITIRNHEQEYQKEILLSVESYRTLSKFIFCKLLGAATNKPNEFLINQKMDHEIFPNLSQAKSHFMKNINDQLPGNIHLLPDSFFRNTDKGDYTLNVDTEAIELNFDQENLKLWAACYMKEITKSKKIGVDYSIEGNEIKIAAK